MKASISIPRADLASKCPNGNGKAPSLLQMATEHFGQIPSARSPVASPDACGVPTGRLLRPREVVARYGISIECLRRNHRAGRLRAFVAPSGFRRFAESDVLRFLGQEVHDSGVDGNNPLLVAIVRVSGAGQARPDGGSDKSSLEHQKEHIQKYCRENYGRLPDEWNISVGSGMNYDRKEYLQLIANIVEKKYRGAILVFTGKNRVCRFGYSLFKYLCNLGEVGQLVEILKDEEEKTANETLTEEILDILTHYTARASGEKVRKLYKRILPPDLLKTCYGMFREGLSFRAIYKELKRRGISEGEKGTFTPNVIRSNILGNIATLERLYGNAPVDNSFVRFFQENIRKDKDGEISRVDLLRAYSKWCKTNREIPLSHPKISKTMRGMNLRWRLHSVSNTVVYMGVAIQA